MVSEIGSKELRWWLKQQSSALIVVFVSSAWRRIASCGVMKGYIDGLSRRYESVILLEFIADQRADMCDELAIIDTPTVIIFRGDKEISRFVDPSSAEAIEHVLNEATNPAGHGHPAMKPAGTVK